MYKQVICFALLIACVSGGVVSVDDCGSVSILNQVRITDCDAQPCIFYRGREYTFEVDGTARGLSAPSNAMPYNVTAVVIIPIVIIEGDACNDLSVGSCPASNGDSFTANMLYRVPATLPAITTRATVRVWDDRGNLSLCFSLMVSLREAPLVASVGKLTLEHKNHLNQ